MRAPSLARRILLFIPAALLVGSSTSCGRRGDPVPRPRALPGACSVRMITLRRLAVTLPTRDVAGASLAGIERVRIYYLPLRASQPRPEEVISKGEIVLERSRPDLPDPGGTLEIDLGGFRRPRGWLVVAAVRVGEVIGAPGEVQVWLDPEL